MQSRSIELQKLCSSPLFHRLQIIYLSIVSCRVIFRYTANQIARFSSTEGWAEKNYYVFNNTYESQFSGCLGMIFFSQSTNKQHRKHIKCTGCTVMSLYFISRWAIQSSSVFTVSFADCQLLSRSC